MEPHRKLVGTERFRPSFDDTPQAYFNKALSFTLKFYPTEFARIQSVRFDCVNPEFFFSEFMWVVHTSGFSARAVGKLMPKLVEAYGHYSSLSLESFSDVFERVRGVFNNRSKALSIWRGACLLNGSVLERGWETYRDEELCTPKLLQKYPHIGKVTCFHLARNIGLLNFVKPDLHLVRMANHWGFTDCDKMCDHMRRNSDGGSSLPLGMVDLALWYAASTFGTESIK